MHPNGCQINPILHPNIVSHSPPLAPVPKIDIHLHRRYIILIVQTVMLPVNFENVPVYYSQVDAGKQLFLYLQRQMLELF